jgi:predicted house-cleaning noncanonical NTP pyrophosphatase (MazG superfamily)
MSENLADIAAKGDYLETLCSLRDKLAQEIVGADRPSDVASLSARLADVLSLIKAVKPAETSTRDELAKKRARRQAAARKSNAAHPDSRAGSGK